MDDLMLLARDGTLDQIRARLALGLPADRGAAALQMAVAWRREDVVKLLLDAGVPIGADALRAATDNRRFDAVARELLTLLLDRGGDVNARDQRGATVLFWAAWLAIPEAVRFLLARGARPELANVDGETPLAAALGRKYVEYCEGYDNTPPPERAFEEVIGLLREAAQTRTPTL